MTGFVFRLQSLLELRTAERDRRREELAAALRAEQILKQQIKGIHQTVQQTRRGLRRHARPGHVNVTRLLDTQRYELVLNVQIQKMEQQLDRVGTEVARRRQAAIEASRDVRVLEKLRARRLGEHRAHEEKSAQRELDEIAIRRTVRKREGHDS